VDSVVDEYNRLVSADPAAALEQWERLMAGFASAGITFDGVPMRSFLRPHFVERAAWSVLRLSGDRLLSLASRVARRAFDGDAARLCAWLAMPEAHARWVTVDPGEPDVVLSRLDAFATAEGPRFVEINSDAPAGFGYGDRMADVFRTLPIFRALAARVPVSYEPSAHRLVEAVLRTWRDRGGSAAPTVAIVDWAEVRTRADQEILQQVFEAAGVRCLLADPQALEVRAGRLWSGAIAVDVVYRRAVLSELIEREQEAGAFFDAYRRGLAVFVNSLRCHLSEDKAFFALLTDEAYGALLTEEEHAFVGRVVPWTRKVEEGKTRKDGQEIDLLPYVLRHRESLVLKPAHAYGGRSVYVGNETDAAAWETAVRAGIGLAWVVQERVAIPEEIFPVFEGGSLAFESLKVNVSPFHVAGSEVGAITRVSRSKVINVSAGGGSVPTFVVG
jgi:uncharacterized circularly permuted ATP-grasp superfamily protein